MRGRNDSMRRWVAALGALTLFVVFALGVVHEYDHDVGHAAESCAVCATVRSPRTTSPTVATLVCVLLAAVFVAMPAGQVVRPVARTTRSTRAPPSA